MTTLADFTTAGSVKILIAGDSGTGKTCSVAALLLAGYRLRILNLESSMQPLAAHAIRLGVPPAYFEALTDVVTIAPQYIFEDSKFRPDVVAAPVWSQIGHTIMNWPRPDGGVDPIYNWPATDVLVIDSLSAISQASLASNRALLARQNRGQAPDAFGRDIGRAQDDIANFLDFIRADVIHCSIVLTAHMEMQGQVWYPAAPGKALAPRIARTFDFGARTEVAPGPQGPEFRMTCIPDTRYGWLKNTLGPIMPPFLPTHLALGWLFEAVKGTVGPSGVSFGALPPTA